jgi:hypothetical protein
MLPFTIAHTDKRSSPLTIDFDEIYVDRISRAFPFPTPRNEFELEGFRKVIATMRANLRPSFAADLGTAIKDFKKGHDCGQPPALPEKYWTNSVSPEYDFPWSAKGCEQMTESYQEICDMSGRQRTAFDKALSKSAKTFTERETEGTKMGSTAETSSSRRSEDERAWLDERSMTRESQGSEQSEKARTRTLRREIRRELRSQRQKKKDKSRRDRRSAIKGSEDDSTLVVRQDGSKKSGRVTINLPATSSSVTLNFV